MFLDELATNATARNVSIIVYSGNNDLLISHRGSEGMFGAFVISVVWGLMDYPLVAIQVNHLPPPPAFLLEGLDVVTDAMVWYR